MLTPWKNSYDQPRQHIKKQRHYFANKGPSGQGYGFPVVMYGCESWTVKKAEHRRIDAFELWCWRTTACQVALSSNVSWSLFKVMSTESVMLSNHLILCPLLFPLSTFPSIRVFSNESVLCIRWPKYWEFQLQHQSFQ